LFVYPEDGFLSEVLSDRHAEQQQQFVFRERNTMTFLRRARACAPQRGGGKVRARKKGKSDMITWT
jgi:hypothetical protein